MKKFNLASTMATISILSIVIGIANHSNLQCFGFCILVAGVFALVSSAFFISDFVYDSSFNSIHK